MNSDGVFSIRSTSAPGRLEFRWTRPAHFEVTLEDAGLHAVSEVHAIVGGQTTDLPTRFFEGLAEDWRGWHGAREWASYERDLQFSATADRRGHVFLLVNLAAGASSDQWKAQASLILEAGQLEDYSRTFRAFLRAEPSAA